MVTQFIQGLYIKQTPGILTVSTAPIVHTMGCTIINSGITNSKWHNTNNCIHGITINYTGALILIQAHI